MNEKEIIEALNKAVVDQAEEKVKMTLWAHDMLSSIDDRLKNHFITKE